MITHSSFSGLRCWERSYPLTAALALSIIGAAELRADESTATATETTADIAAAAPASPEPSIYDKVWGLTEWYNNDDNKIIQQFNFVGRFQLDYARVDAVQGDHEEWNIRRARVGAKAKLFHDFTLHAEADLNPQEGETYQKLTDAYIAWAATKDLKLTLGKQSVAFTLDGQTSSKKLLTLERNNLANNLWFTDEYAPGFTVTGSPGQWVYQAGVFSSADSDTEFGEIEGGVFGLLTAGYDFNEALGVDEALLRLNYVYNAPENPSSSFANRPLEQIGSLNFVLEQGRWGVSADLSGATGIGSVSDLWGATVMPWFNILDNLQLVTRYTFVRSDDPNGVRLNRYETGVLRNRGDEYQEFYLGLNWYLYGHKLKLQTGIDYAYMEDRANDGGAYDGWGWITGLRVYW